MANQKTVTVNGKDYKLQHPGVRWYLQLSDRTKTRNNNIQQERYVDELLANVVVEPKVKLDDFTSVADMEKLVGEIESFLRA